MPVTAFLPSELTAEITDLGANDYLVVQKSGDAFLSKMKAGAIAPYDLGAALKNGDIAQAFYIKELYMPEGSAGAPAAIHGPYNSSLGRWSWQFTVYDYNFSFLCKESHFRNLDNNDWSTSTAKLWQSRFASGTPNRDTIGFWLYNYAVGVSSNVYGELHMMTNGVAQGIFTNGELASKNVRPTVDNTYDCGTGSYRWNDVYGVNGRFSNVYNSSGLITSSDASDKTDVQESDLGLTFINRLRPRRYRRVKGGEVRVPLLDEHGNPRKDPVTGTLLGQTETRAGVRPHYGFVAQEVKALLGDEDFAGYVYDEKTGVHGLRYEQFIAPLVKAVQELSAQVTAQANRIAVLEQAAVIA
jgi:hypothetical protein